jgi:hypothetical protein
MIAATASPAFSTSSKAASTHARELRARQQLDGDLGDTASRPSEPVSSASRS